MLHKGKTETRVILLWQFYRIYTETGWTSRGRDYLEKPCHLAKVIDSTWEYTCSQNYPSCRIAPAYSNAVNWQMAKLVVIFFSMPRASQAWPDPRVNGGSGNYVYRSLKFYGLDRAEMGLYGRQYKVYITEAVHKYGQ